MDATPESLWILDVPVNQRPLTALPIERKQQFLDQLRAAIDTAFQERAAGTPAEEDAPCQEEPPLAQRTCAICRGGCCPNGGEHAYITPQTIHRYLTAVPGATPTEILDRYESYFGENTFEGSCVFHRELGCALPRHLRSSVCNSYACRSAGAARDIALLGPRGRPVVIVALEHLHIVGWEILPRDQCGGERSASVAATTTEIATS